MSSLTTAHRSFFELYARGEISAEEIGRYVERWHEGLDLPAADTTLAQYLGLTDDEYAQWVEDPGALPVILNARGQTTH